MLKRAVGTNTLNQRLKSLSRLLEGKGWAIFKVFVAFQEGFWMPYRILCNGTKQKSSETRSGLALTSSRFTPLHKIRYGIYNCVHLTQL